MTSSPQQTWHDLHASGAERLFPSGERRQGTDRPGAATGGRVESPGVEYITYGPPLADGASIEIPATYGSVEVEYAAIRNGAAIMHRPERSTIRVTGDDRITFLNRMLTQELADLEPGQARQAFWLNRKGRIEADLLLLERGSEMLIDVDAHDCANVIETLDSFLFSDDVTLEDASESFERFTVFGKLPSPTETDAAIADDATSGLPRSEWFVPADDAHAWWGRMLELMRPAGWFAYNIARIEAGIPQMHIDFNNEHLPHESGLLRERVSFTKGCYLGQEIVARMESRGRPKQMVVGLRIDGDALPIEGTQIFEPGEESPESPIGAVTSSTLSPLFGAQPVALAMIRTKHAEVGNAVRLFVDGGPVTAHVAERPLVTATTSGGEA